MINDIYNNEFKNVELMYFCNNFNIGGFALFSGFWGEDFIESLCCKVWFD